MFSDGRPKRGKNSTSITQVQSNSIEAPILLVSIDNEISVAELNSEEWFIGIY